MAHKDWQYIPLPLARNLFWVAVKEVRPACFDDLADAPLAEQKRYEAAWSGSGGKRTRHVVRQEKRLVETIQEWATRWKLDMEWCQEHAMAQLRSWSRSEDAEEKRFPFWTPIDEGIEDPMTGESRKIELRRKPEGEVEHQSIPEEFEFRLDGDGWRVHEREPRKTARARLQKAVFDAIDEYLDIVEKLIESDKKNWGEFREIHFRWLAARVVPETSGGKVWSRERTLEKLPPEGADGGLKTSEIFWGQSTERV